jgi:DNA ligase-1
VLLIELVTASDRTAATRARREKVALLADLLRRLSGDEVAIGGAFLAGELRQQRAQIGWAALRDADPGAAAAQPSLTLAAVDAAFATVASSAGAGAQAARREALGGLLAAATAVEQDFLRRLVVGELRQGALEALLLDAVAEAADLPAAAVRRAWMLGGDLPTVVAAALGEGERGLQRFRLRLLTPVQPMLAQPAASPADALAQLGRAAFEWKLDGARVQLHRDGGEVRVFTRTGIDVTAAVPELVEAARALPAAAFVLDGEAIALEDSGRPRPFQVTMRRFGRRRDVERLRAELPLRAFWFDLLHLDGDDCFDRPAAARWQLLDALLPAPQRIPREIPGDPDAAARFLQRALGAGHEGAMAKALDAPYEAGRRGGHWLKLKVATTLDLVVLAVEQGSGRRSAWLSNLHLGARDPSTGGFVMLGKTFKGMTDEVLRWQTDALQRLATGREGHVVHVRPELVVEIALDGVQRSPHYPGGLALRFARLVRYRPDKTAAEADTIDRVRALGPGPG